VNPNHLRWATARENGADAVKHGTTLKGERHHHAKLTADEVREIRKLDDGTWPPRYKIAALFEVSAATIFEIATRRTWRHI
jgi:hypothetical protein